MLVLGEVLWDVFDDTKRLGGAPLNFAAHARRLGHEVLLVSALGDDALGREAIQLINGLDLSGAFLQCNPTLKTGTARVHLGPGDRTTLVIDRPAAYDGVRLTDKDLESLARLQPEWFYYGTLFPSAAGGKEVLERLLQALRETTKFYDLNLRPGFCAPELVSELLGWADVVKLNEDELQSVHEFTGLPLDIEAFCRDGTKRYAWSAACVTLGARGCAVFAKGHFVEAHAHPVEVADTVGAGDAFAAAFMHGLSHGWDAGQIAAFANQLGALVASRHGAIPEWTLSEVAEPGGRGLRATERSRSAT